jgi:hypothetical protein
MVKKPPPPKRVGGSKPNKAQPLAKQKKSQQPPNGNDRDPNINNKNKTPKRRSSFWGLIGVATAFVSAWGYSLYLAAQNTKKRHQKDARILRSMWRKPLFITEHAKCRQDCRHISTPDIFNILSNTSTSRINHRKSEPKLRPCAKYTVDGTVGVQNSSGRNIQAVFSACPTQTRVVTVIDTDTDWPCGPC